MANLSWQDLHKLLTLIKNNFEQYVNMFNADFEDKFDTKLKLFKNQKA